MKNDQVSENINTKNLLEETINTVSKKSATITHMMYDGTSIVTFTNDAQIVNKWFNCDRSGDIPGKCANITYLMTIDSCIFPQFNQINFIDTPRRSMTIHNAGGSSDKSEALSMQYMNDLYGIIEFIPEMEVEYWIEYKICDYLMRYKGINIGVSVTRAITYPFKNEYTYDMAIHLLNKKLYGLIVARNAISDKHKFYKCILHIWCMTASVAYNLKKAHAEIIRCDINHTYDNVYIICTICPHEYIYTNFL